MTIVRTSVTWLLALAVAALPLLGQVHVVHDEAEFAAALGAAEADCEAPHDHLEAPHHDHACELCLQLAHLGWRSGATDSVATDTEVGASPSAPSDVPAPAAASSSSIRGPPSLL